MLIILTKQDIRRKAATIDRNQQHSNEAQGCFSLFQEVRQLKEETLF
jgi:hypothetical protein